jgi:hypothetical protein
MRFLALIASCLLAGGSLTLSAQSRALMTNSPRPIALPATPGNAVVLGSVVLGQPRSFSMFNIQAAGTITPDPDLNGAAFQLEFLVCDKADCTGDLHWAVRILPEADAGQASRVIATRSFGVSTHNVEPVVLTNLKPAPANGVLYLAAVIRVVNSPATPAFSAKLNLLRLDVLP